MQKKKMLICSDAQESHTGFSKEIVHILPQLQKEYEVAYYGFMSDKDQNEPMKLYGAMVGSPEDPYGKRLDSVIKDFKPDFIFANQDIQVIQNYVLGPALMNGVPIISWDIVDCPRLPPGYFSYPLNVEHHIFQTEYCKKTFYDSVPYLKSEDHEVIRPAIALDYLKYIEVEKHPKPQAVFFCNGKNIPRKYMPTLIDAVYLLRGFDNLFKVIIHTHNIHGVSPDIDALIKRKEITNIRFTTEISGKQFLTEEELAEFYHTADFFVLPTGREGLGIPYLEAMACGAINIGTKCTSVIELLHPDRGLLIEPTSFIYEANTDSIINYIVSPNDLAQCMLACLKEKELQSMFPELRQQAYNFVKQLTPERCARKLIRNINSFLGKPKNMDRLFFTHPVKATL